MSEMNEQKPYNASDPEQVKKRGAGLRIREIQKKGALKKMMADPEGRMWIWDLLSLCGAYRSSFSSDGLVMAFNEGRRDIGNQLIVEINRLSGGPELYMRMAIENQVQEKD